ncbi:MAG: glycine cleavage system protein T [Candidatus Tectomicrobia bacterium RIFCSPLOWO2_12_FULL_69_37]|nr:MAG: glycine cleavage system protein T [Candidatus Tectomicrobia bacterium RIFCSPLOWO2_12_FULL_69_37]OGL63218.1 MAG: glycine cleavage system protein T [Candidatus Tectomicrobia bacterium RIFCSPLOWO2_02_FULL_70_19]
MAEPGDALRRTSLYETHVAAGAKMVPFAGFEMPVQYTGVIEEHHAVRQAAGLFDVSHMGEFEARGPGAAAFLRRLVTNDVSRLEVGRVMYCTMCREDGGIIDDLTVYRLADERYMAVVNASNIGKDWAWMAARKGAGVEFRDVSSETGLLALQGPRAEAVLAGLLPGGGDLGAIPYYGAQERTWQGKRVLVSRTGYTGEDGFELYCGAPDAPALWEALMARGGGEGLKPCGLGARDTLRTEMKFALYGNDIDEATNPLEAGLGWVVKFQAGEFIGREALLGIKERGLSRKLVGFEMVDRGIPRHGAPILAGGRNAGVVTSGTMSPTLGKAIGIGYVPLTHAAEGCEIAVEIRDKARAARVVETPFYRREKA